MSGILLCALAAATAGLKTPETSSLFDRIVDPHSGVVSYLLRPGLVAHNQQSIYFTAKSMTDDGRFLLFDVSGDEFAVRDGKRVPARKEKAVIDFLNDEIVRLPGIGGQIPFIDTVNDRVVYVNRDGVWARDLRNDPRKPLLLSKLPSELIDPSGKEVRYCTHLTLTEDRRKAFFDAGVAGIDLQGLLDFTTGKFEKWGTCDFMCNHGQIHPFNERLALCAWEMSWEKKVWGKDRKLVAITRPQEDINPRLWLMRPNGEYRMFPPMEGWYATHENWSQDGTLFYWCCGMGVYACDLKTFRQQCLCPNHAAHSFLSADNNCLVYDWMVGKWWRGCPWRVNFWNRKTSRHVFIHTKCEAYADEKNQTGLGLHPDPHPQFVCHDRYVVCTYNTPGRMHLSVTPVAQLLEMTATPDPALKIRPRKELELEWEGPVCPNIPYEVVLDRKKLGDSSGLDRLQAIGVYAVTANGTHRLSAEAMKSEMRTDNYILRFCVPKDAKRLFCRLNEDDPFLLADSADVENIFAGALGPSRIGAWQKSASVDVVWRAGGLVISGGEKGVVRYAAYEAPVPKDAVGKPVKFEIDVRSRSRRVWNSVIRLRQVDGRGDVLPAFVCDPSLTTQPERSPDLVSHFRASGRLDPKAVAVIVGIGMGRPDDDGDDPEGARPVLEVTRLALRPAADMKVKE